MNERDSSYSNIYQDNSLDNNNSVSETTALMDGHVGESNSRHSDRFENPNKNIKNRKQSNDPLRSYGTTEQTLPQVSIAGSRNNQNENPGGSQRDRPVDVVLEEEDGLKYGAQHVIKLFVPVSLCILLVVITISKINFYTTTDVFLPYTPFHESSPDAGTKLWNAIANSLILMVVIIIMTILLILLYKHRFYRTIHAWLILSSFLLLFCFSFLYMKVVLTQYNIPLDYITALIILWNFGVVGMICIHWQGPLKLQQGYLIFVAALMALVFIKYLPTWTTWFVLAVISIWDLVAVLAPKGPLRILVETAQERNEPIFPALIYSSTVVYSLMSVDDNPSTSTSATDPSSSSNKQKKSNSKSKKRNNRNEEGGNETNRPVEDEEAGFTEQWAETSQERTQRRQIEVQANISSNPNRSTEYRTVATEAQQTQQIVEEERGIKLGLGDFIFYSVLVGKASTYGDWNTTVAGFIAILIGLCLTLLLLAIYRKALPALPISIAFGLIFCLFTSYIVNPFMENLVEAQIFI